ncbi:hypothetical protein CONCODRAFT_169463 [Conidiobolus coronatus NRRL 28638]|uniref:Tetraspannin-domain-containing protein n=1 Tax=Conidiobolus coronatus (strain ATCC 28846 / CBS 209.66 / NRRL 28638) TaxID=796925 RepID=A0A137PA24_CONC2|nr:hypothetical protein CONCODRAFT_169463 [Conidiobolus coronatus NRRL 28638]|eukprot:KXN71847.1 hypothetical protein CONCODRAFT_169463 [Conidiobolus coronatus NRRL 28638]
MAIDYEKIGMRTLKIVSFLFHSLTTLAGLILMAFGIYVLVNSQAQLYGIGMPIAYIVGGFLAVINSLYGFFSSSKTSAKFHKIFLILSFIMVLYLLILVIITFVGDSRTESNIQSGWNDAYSNNPRTLQYIQQKFECCGLTDVEDNAIPKSSKDACLKSELFGYNQPCLDLITKASHISSRLLGLESLVTLILFIISLGLGYILYKKSV